MSEQNGLEPCECGGKGLIPRGSLLKREHVVSVFAELMQDAGDREQRDGDYIGDEIRIMCAAARRLGIMDELRPKLARVMRYELPFGGVL